MEPEHDKWKAKAACRGMDPELFYPERGDWVAVENARAICATCNVTAECLDYALGMAEGLGIWGGYSERQRRQMKRKRAREARAEGVVTSVDRTQVCVKLATKGLSDTAIAERLGVSPRTVSRMLASKQADEFRRGAA